MMNGIQSKTIGTIAIGSGLIGASIYFVMITVTLAHIESLSGLIPFDMRPLGYGPAGATALLDGLGSEGRSYYLSRQIPLDLLYPAALAVTLVATICWFGQRIENRKLVRIGIAVSIGCALFDYVENLGIAVMLWAGPDVSAPLVYATSTATIAKSMLTIIAVIFTVLVGVDWARKPRATLP